MKTWRKAVVMCAAAMTLATAMAGQDEKNTPPDDMVQTKKLFACPGMPPMTAVAKPNWTFGVFASGGTGLNDRSDVQFANIGVRGGRVFNRISSYGWYGGTLEYNAEFIPYTHYFWKGQAGFNGYALNPFVFKWNFVNFEYQKFVPFFLVHGGFVHTTKNMPPGNTADYNFTSGVGVGANYFVRPNKAISFDVRALHLSNASIGKHNPGINASLQFTIGYNWYKR